MVPAISSLGTSHMGLFSPTADRRSLPPLPQHGPSQQSHKDMYTCLHHPGPHRPVWVSLSHTPAGVFTSGLTPEAPFPVLG